MKINHGTFPENTYELSHANFENLLSPTNRSASRQSNACSLILAIYGNWFTPKFSVRQQIFETVRMTVFWKCPVVDFAEFVPSSNIRVIVGDDAHIVPLQMLSFEIIYNLNHINTKASSAYVLFGSKSCFSSIKTMPLHCFCLKSGNFDAEYNISGGRGVGLTIEAPRKKSLRTLSQKQPAFSCRSDKLQFTLFCVEKILIYK